MAELLRLRSCCWNCMQVLGQTRSSRGSCCRCGPEHKELCLVLTFGLSPKINRESSRLVAVQLPSAKMFVRSALAVGAGTSTPSSQASYQQAPTTSPVHKHPLPLTSNLYYHELPTERCLSISYHRWNPSQLPCGGQMTRNTQTTQNSNDYRINS
jgi:hypothetical protein